MEDKPAQACIRQPGHDGPCNGFPRKECEVIAELTRQRDEALEGEAEAKDRETLYREELSGARSAWQQHHDEIVAALTARAEAAERDRDEAIGFRHNMERANKIQQEDYANMERQVAAMRDALTSISEEGFWGSDNDSASLVRILDEHKELADRALIELKATAEPPT